MKASIMKEMPLCMSELRSLLEETKAKRGELSFRAQKTLDHLTAVPTLPLPQAKSIEQAIEKKNISRMRDVYVKKMLDVIPVSEKDAKMILSGFNVTLTNDDLRQVVEVFKEHTKA